MKERPILFNGEMVRAILEGRKTQTRRPVTLPLHEAGKEVAVTVDAHGLWLGKSPQSLVSCPFGCPGDRLWVRETWAPYPDPHAPPNDRPLVAYRSTQEAECINVKWTPSIHMPRWASRINLEVTSVEVERLHTLKTAGAVAEGFDNQTAFLKAFGEIYEQTYGRNPWVWVISFRRLP